MTIPVRARVLQMVEEDKELEAIKHEVQQLRSDTEKAFAQANIVAAYEKMELDSQVKKAERKQAKEKRVKARKKPNQDES